MKGYVKKQLRGNNRGYANNQKWLTTKQKEGKTTEYQFYKEIEQIKK